MNPHTWHDPHIIRTGKSLLQAIYITLGVFLFLFVLFHIGGALYTSLIATKSSEDFDIGIKKDLSYLKEQGNAVAKNDLLQKFLIEKDSERLVELTKKEISMRGIGLMGVVDNNGVTLSRTKSVGSLGSNAFLTTPHGRAVDINGSVESVEIAGFNPAQLLMTTGRRIMHNDLIIGALFANHLMDDKYASRFRDTYLSHGTEVVFYTKEFGVYGNSFSDLETHKLVDSYFNSGSGWIQNGISDKTVYFKNGSFYFVKNIVFPGLEQSPGGALIFTPRRDISDIANIITSLLTLCVFVFFALRHHYLRSPGEERGWRYYSLLASISILVVVMVFLALRLNNVGYLKLERIPYTLYNSTLRLQPEFGIYDLDFEQRFSIIVDTGDEDINTVSVGLIFDPNAIEVKSIQPADSTCSYVIESKIDDRIGKANLSCVVPKSDGERGSFSIAEVVVLPKRTGTFTISFDKEDTKVLASDGLGTDVLRMAQSGSYRVDNFDSTLTTTTTTTTTTGRAFVVFSPTHPNQSRWYNSSTARFVWRGKPDAVYVYAFDTSPDTAPSKTHTTQDSTVSLPIPGDGIFYFHLQLAEGGPIAHYRLQADKIPPAIVSIHLSKDVVLAGDVVRFSFEAEDAGSGIEHNYYVDLGNHLFLPTGSQLFIPFLEVGDQEIKLRVYDGANNYSEKSQIIHVKAP